MDKALSPVNEIVLCVCVAAESLIHLVPVGLYWRKKAQYLKKTLLWGHPLLKQGLHQILVLF